MGEAVGMTDPVRYELDGDVAVITIDDGKANAVSHAVATGLIDAVGRAGQEAAAAAVLGRPGRFSAGFDLGVMTSGIDNARDLLRAGAEASIAIHDAPIPVVIGATGHALAMGAILLLSADVRIGAEGSFKIGLNEVSIGIPVPRFVEAVARTRIGPTHLSRAVGLAEVFDPDGAVRAGYLDRIAPADDVTAAAVDEAHRLATYVQPRAFRATREIARAATTAAMRQGLVADLSDFFVEPPAS
jgi:enoyl-CoA hydratase